MQLLLQGDNVPRGQNFKGKRGRWKPGESGNPQGRPNLSDEVKNLQKLTVEEHIRVVTYMLRISGDELYDILTNPAATCQELLIAKLLERAIKNGDCTTYERIMDRVIGKVALPINHNGNTTLTFEESNAKEKLISKLNSIASNTGEVASTQDAE
jgi:hypothetical protein